MTADLFDAPSSTACRRCHQDVLRVRDDEIGINVDLQPAPLPVTQPIPTDRAIYQHHPSHGWHAQSSPGRNGYPIHLMHTCPSTRQKEEHTS